METLIDNIVLVMVSIHKEVPNIENSIEVRQRNEIRISIEVVLVFIVIKVFMTDIYCEVVEGMISFRRRLTVIYIIRIVNLVFIINDL